MSIAGRLSFVVLPIGFVVLAACGSERSPSSAGEPGGTSSALPDVVQISAESLSTAGAVESDVDTVLSFGVGGGPEGGDPFAGYDGPRIFVSTPTSAEDFLASTEAGETVTFRLRNFDEPSVEVAVYDVYQEAGENLASSVTVGLEGGAASVEIETGPGLSGRCFAVVADPPQAAVHESNYELDGVPVSEFGNPLDARLCIS